MEQAAFIQAILAEPEDDTPRLIFADWLEAHGQKARAAWIRVSCQLAKLDFPDPTLEELVRQQVGWFEQCCPEWWQYVPGVVEQNDRGMFRFEVRSKTAVTKLGKVAWLSAAVADGWLEGIAVTRCDSSLASVMARWPAPARQVPLFVRPSPQISDAGLAFYLGAPHLWGLDLSGHAAGNPSIQRLGRRTDLRTLRLDGMPDEREEDVAGLFEQVGQLSGLRRLTVRGYERPTDEGLRPLAGLSGLQELYLSGCVALTDACLAPLRSLTGLQRLEVGDCEGISEAGIAQLRHALPALQDERL